jgi:hypothetical protein
MALTEEQMQKALNYVARKMQEDNTDIDDIGGVVRWMIENPLPSKAEYQAQVTAWEEEDKEVRRAHLEAELAKLDE